MIDRQILNELYADIRILQLSLDYSFFELPTDEKIEKLDAIIVACDNFILQLDSEKRKESNILNEYPQLERVISLQKIMVKLKKMPHQLFVPDKNHKFEKNLSKYKAKLRWQMLRDTIGSVREITDEKGRKHRIKDRAMISNFWLEKEKYEDRVGVSGWANARYDLRAYSELETFDKDKEKNTWGYHIDNEPFRVTCKEGKLTIEHEGETVLLSSYRHKTSKFIQYHSNALVYVLTYDQNEKTHKLFVGHNLANVRGLINHSHLAKGISVVCAGEMEVYSGELTFINLSSGHYRPTPSNLIRALKILESMGINLKGVKCQSEFEGETYDADVFLERKGLFLPSQRGGHYYKIALKRLEKKNDAGLKEALQKLELCEGFKHNAGMLLLLQLMLENKGSDINKSIEKVSELIEKLKEVDFTSNEEQLRLAKLAQAYIEGDYLNVLDENLNTQFQAFLEQHQAAPYVLSQLSKTEWSDNTACLETLNKLKKLKHLDFLSAGFRGEKIYKQKEKIIDALFESKNEALVMKLIDSGLIDVHKKEVDGFVILNWCLSNNMNAPAIKLIELGVNVKQHKKEYPYPLQYAAENGMKEACIKLLEYGADPTEKAISGNAFDVAKRKNQTEILELFEQHASKAISPGP